MDEGGARADHEGPRGVGAVPEAESPRGDATATDGPTEVGPGGDAGAGGDASVVDPCWPPKFADRRFADALLRSGRYPDMPEDYAAYALDLRFFEPTSIEGIECFTRLAHLTMFAGPVTDLWRVGRLTKLTNLDVRSMRVTDLSFVNSLTGLKLLDMSVNEIVDIAPVGALTRLESLWLGNNKIADIGPLASLSHLTRLGLNENQIADVSPLVANPGFGAGAFMWISGNRINCATQRANLQALVTRGAILVDNPCP